MKVFLHPCLPWGSLCCSQGSGQPGSLYIGLAPLSADLLLGGQLAPILLMGLFRKGEGAVLPLYRNATTPGPLVGAGSDVGEAAAFPCTGPAGGRQSLNAGKKKKRLACGKYGVVMAAERENPLVNRNVKFS